MKKRRACASCGAKHPTDELERPVPGAPRLCITCAARYVPRCARSDCGAEMPGGSVITRVGDAVICSACAEAWTAHRAVAVRRAWETFVG